MVLLPLAEIIARPLRLSVPGAGPFTQHLTLWVAFLGAALAAREGRLLSLATGEFVPEGAWRRAAKLFAALLNEHRRDMTEEQSTLVARVESGLLSVEDLLSALLDISRLDTAAPTPKREDFPVAELFTALDAQFSQTFEEQGLTLRFARTTSRGSCHSAMMWASVYRSMMSGEWLISCSCMGPARGALSSSGRR